MGKPEIWIVALGESLSQTGYFALTLEKPVSGRCLPIILGSAEAQAIALRHEKLVPPHPLTHGLLH